MLKVIRMTKFLKDLELAKKRGKPMSKIQLIINILTKEERLPEKHRPHKLWGEWNSYYDCHIEPDWMLIYKVEEGNLFLARTGSHSDLF